MRVGGQTEACATIIIYCRAPFDQGLTVFGNLNLISRFYFSAFSLVFDLIKIYITLKIVFDRISKQAAGREKYSAARHILNSPLGVRKCVRTRSLCCSVFEHGSHTPSQLRNVALIYSVHL